MTIQSNETSQTANQKSTSVVGKPEKSPALILVEQAKAEQPQPPTPKPKKAAPKPAPKQTETKSPSQQSERSKLAFSGNLSAAVRADINKRIIAERHHRELNPVEGVNPKRQYVIDEALHLGLQQLEKRRKK